MKKLLILILLLWCSTCFAADWYVDPAAADDSGDATTRNTARKTIQSVVGLIRTNGNAADTVNLMAGTYDSTTQGATWMTYFSAISQAGKVTTIQKDPQAEGTITLTIANTGYAVGILFSDPAKQIIYKNVTIDSSTANNCVEIGANLGVQLTFDTCVISTSTKTLVFCSTDTTHSRFIIFTDCTITCGATSPLNVIVAELIKFDGGSFNKTTTAVGQLIYSTGSIDTVIADGTTFTSIKNVFGFQQAGEVVRNLFIKNCTFNMTPTTNSIACVNISDIVKVGRVVLENNTFAYTGDSDPMAILLGSIAATYTNKLYTPQITNNTFTHSRANYYGRAMRIGVNIWGAVVENNTCTGFEDFCYNCGWATQIIGNTAKVTNGVRNWGSGGSIVKNNTFVSVNGHDTGRCIVMGRLNFATASAADTTFTATTVVDGHGTPWGGDGNDITTGLSQGSHLLALAKTGGTSQFDPDHWGVVIARVAGTVTVSQWFKADGSGDTETPSAGDAVMITEYGEQDYIYNNIFDATDASDCVTFDFNPRDGIDYLDYNCYIAGSVSLSNLGEGVQTTLATQQAKWATWSTVFPLNDAHSVDADPLFVDKTNNDFRLKPGSPCLNTGKPTLNSGYTSMGAWQQKQGARRRRIP